MTPQQEAAALRNFAPAHVRVRSIAPGQHDRDARPMSASPPRSNIGTAAIRRFVPKAGIAASFITSPALRKKALVAAFQAADPKIENGAPAAAKNASFGA